jgi:hypothetical protein
MASTKRNTPLKATGGCVLCILSSCLQFNCDVLIRQCGNPGGVCARLPSRCGDLAISLIFYCLRSFFSCSTGKLAPYMKSEPIPTSNSERVKVVVGKTFNQIVNEPGKDGEQPVSTLCCYFTTCANLHCSAVGVLCAVVLYGNSLLHIFP